ncbi:MAG: AGE family epimerase/isomerase [Verrucomicrobiales bacterium]|nr:AGE family epimerase/isomerase [Verrucomicrobiales bacterium]MCP5526869.1 AGE family epimerase/isomerase [Verrucomicrobiales bacterium]
MTALDLNQLASCYRDTLLDDVVPFWLRHGPDREHGGLFTCLDRDGTVIDTDKSIWFQGRAGWLFATLYNTVEPRPEWLDLAQSCVGFLRLHGAAPDGKLYFTVTREGRPLRNRRYVFSESFAAIACAALVRATGNDETAAEAVRLFDRFLHASFTPGALPAKQEVTRPMQAIGPCLIGIGTAQELRTNLGDIIVGGRSCTAWIDELVARIRRDFLKPEEQALMEVVGADGSIVDHFDGRTLNPGHALEAAWFILHEARLREDAGLVRLGTTILDWMWVRGWDEEHGGLFYFRDLRGLPVQEYWHDMKFWWPHCEAIIATLLAWRLTGEARYAEWHRRVHDWAFSHFPDPGFGEWYGYLHRDGRISVPLKGNLWKGPFHLPRMLRYCWQLACETAQPLIR